MERQNSLLGILAGIGTGAAAMYFLDPDRGARRRAIATDKLASSVKGIHGEASLGQGERGAAGYEDSGSSELFYLDEELEEVKKDDQQG